MQAVLDEVGPELLQFHGDETPQACARYGHRYLRAFRAGAPGLATAEELASYCRAYGEAAGWLFDSYSGAAIRHDGDLAASGQGQRAILRLDRAAAGQLDARLVTAIGQAGKVIERLARRPVRVRLVQHRTHQRVVVSLIDHIQGWRLYATN
ncbi:hypothetical protein [Lactiplantibacillus plantarum]|uniref:hypothetical protein n=1 Tax=Lactiplantibacillus plantarum TaxID=1590 RepID=UPI0040460EDB